MQSISFYLAMHQKLFLNVHKIALFPFFLFSVDHGSAWYRLIFSGGIIMQPGHYLAQAPSTPHCLRHSWKKDHICKILLWLQIITQLSFEAATCMGQA